VIAINQLFEVGGKRTSRQVSALAGFKTAEARFNDARRLLDLAVTKAYIDALLAEADVQILSQSAVTLRQEAGMAETRLKAGDFPWWQSNRNRRGTAGLSRSVSRAPPHNLPRC
jgi:outer membrane protein TolC